MTIIILILIAIAVIHYLAKTPPSKDSEPTTEAADLALYRFNKHQYLHSPEWASKRKLALARAHYHCEMCHAETNLHVHHITYKNLYREQPSELIALCPSCHTLVHDTHGYPQSVADYNSFYGPPLPIY